ncbi:uncharacterized protein [Halyomorpha halys]|uniref:uncharacterized protein n=1 Tax=Halyomorpha halys TaxID=286706 RepID=UPI0034D2C575
MSEVLLDSEDAKALKAVLVCRVKRSILNQIQPDEETPWSVFKERLKSAFGGGRRTPEEDIQEDRIVPIKMFSFPFSNAGGSCFGKNHSHQGRFVNRIPVIKDEHFAVVDGIPVRKLFVGNLRPLIMKRQLVLLFSTFGNIVDVSIARKTDTKLNKSSFGFITFETPVEATRALKNRHSLYISNRKVHVFPADSWHQPIELPNGEILWDRRKGQADVEDEFVVDGSH